PGRPQSRSFPCGISSIVPSYRSAPDADMTCWAWPTYRPPGGAYTSTHAGNDALGVRVVVEEENRCGGAPPRELGQDACALLDLGAVRRVTQVDDERVLTEGRYDRSVALDVQLLDRQRLRHAGVLHVVGDIEHVLDREDRAEAIVGDLIG